jgi:transcription elongation factor Elf1
MIKLICPKCMSDNIFYLDKESADELFECGNCSKEFAFQKSQWESE